MSIMHTDCKENTACFTGHRPKDLELLREPESERFIRYRQLLKLTIIELHEKHGVNCFLSGMALGVDMIAAEIIIELKAAGYEMKLVAAIPCRTQSKHWSDKDSERYNRIIEASDEVVILSEDYTKSCMQERNRYMVKRSGYCIATWSGSEGGTSLTVGMAKKAELKLIIINPDDLSIIPFDKSYDYKNDELTFFNCTEEKTAVSLGPLKGKLY